jgi:hypothetical protein
MSQPGSCNPEHCDPQKATPEQKPVNRPNQPVQQKPQVPVGQPKSPQSEQEKHPSPTTGSKEENEVVFATDKSFPNGPLNDRKQKKTA